MQHFGLVKDGGAVIEGVTVTVFTTQEDRDDLRKKILANHAAPKQGGNIQEFLERIEKEVEKGLPAYTLAAARRRWSGDGMSEVRPFPQE